MNTLLEVIEKRWAEKRPIGIEGAQLLLNIATCARQMRTAQEVYWDTRDPADLGEVFRLQEAVDELIATPRGRDE